MPVRLTQLLRAALLGAPLAFVGLAQAPAEAAPARPTLAQATSPAPILQDVQYYGDRPRRRDRRCWMEERRVRFRDGYGRVHVRVRPVRVCR